MASFRRFPWVLLVVVLSLFLAGCMSKDPQSTFSRDGDVSSLQFDLFALIFWLMAGVFVVVEGVLLYAVIRFRRKPGEQVLPSQTHGNTSLELAWTIAPILVLAVIMVPTVQAIGTLSQPPTGKDILNVKVIGHQWWWEFQYSDLDVVTANELHIPVGKTVNVTLESADVIHAFWVPRLAGKQDAVPSYSNPMWFNAKQPGVYLGQCAEFCGVDHALMKFRVIAQPEGEFQKWVAAEKAPQPQPAGKAAEGAALFLTKGCIACHTIQGNPAAQGKIGPNLTHFASRTSIASGIRENNSEELGKWLRNPDAVKPGNVMGRDAPVYKVPELALSEDDITKLVAYLQSLK